MTKNLVIILLSSIIISACGGGGGGSSSTPIVNSGSGSGSTSTPTYSYDEVSANYNGKSWDTFSQMRRAMSGGIATGFSGFSDHPSNISITEYSNYIEIVLEGSTNGLEESFSYDFNLTDTNTSGDPLYNADNQVVAYLFTTNFSNATLYGFVFDTDALSSNAGIDYTNVGFLDFVFSDGSRDTFAFNYGDLTDSGDMPTSGTASYELGSYMIFNAFVQGDGRYSSSDDISLVSQGEGALTANFGTNMIDGSINFTRYYSYYDFLYYGADAQSQILNVPSTQLTMSGSMSSSSFTGSAILQDGSDLYGQGVFQGSFFGPNADEVSGTFLVAKDQDQDNSGADWWDVVGTFIGCKTPAC